MLILRRTDLEVNILQPFVKDILRASREADDYDDTAEDYHESDQTLENGPRPLDVDVEEAAVEESEHQAHDPCFELDGQKVWKGRYLSERFKAFRNPSSQDRLKRYANIPRYALKQSTMPSLSGLDDDFQNGPTVRLDHPIASLLNCDDRLFVCIGEVNDLVNDSAHVEQIHVNHLIEPSVFVTYQLLYLIPATIDYDPGLKHDWRWSFQ